MTRRRLAQVLEVSEYTLYRWEHGDRQPASGCLLDFALEAIERRLNTGVDLDSGKYIEDWSVPDSVPDTPPDVLPAGGAP